MPRSMCTRKGTRHPYAGPQPTPGCTDICFVWEGTVEECQKMLENAGVTIIRGPVARPGGRGRGTAPSLSLYARDPDGNLLEWMTYLETPSPGVNRGRNVCLLPR